MNKKKPRLAIFDIDGTIFRSSLLVELVEAFIAEGIFPPRTRRRYQAAHEAWVNRRGAYDDYIMSVVAAFRKNLKGVSYADFARVSERVVSAHKNRVYRYTRDLVKKLKARKYRLIAVSHSPKGIVERFAKNLGFDKVYGILYELDGKENFTGKMMYEDLIFDKAKIVKRILEKEGLSLSGSYGVGDTESDISFLEMVAHPVCFNPNVGLFRAAKKRGWRVVVERKDVVYEM